MATTTILTDDLRSTAERVERLDFTGIKAYMCDASSGPHWARHIANEVELEYRRFLILNALHPDERIVPGPLIDDFWHRHILDTVAYQRDCAEIFGHFLHHVPCGPGMEPMDESARERTLEVYEDHFPAWETTYWTVSDVSHIDPGPTTVPVPSECYSNPDM